MDPVAIALWAFTLVNAIRVLSYIPQIVKIYRDDQGAAGVSYSTWGMFAVSHLTTVFYALLVVSDVKMAMVFVGNFLACLIILILTAWKQGYLSAARVIRIVTFVAPGPAVWKVGYAGCLVAIGSFVGASFATKAPWVPMQVANATTVSASKSARADRIVATVTQTDRRVEADAVIPHSAAAQIPAFSSPGSMGSFTTTPNLVGSFGAFQLVLPFLAAPDQGLASTPPAELVDLTATFERAEKALKDGNLGEARLLYNRLNEVGDARGAAGLARSYDPAVLATLPVFGHKGDRVQVQRWQQRAAELSQGATTTGSMAGQMR